MTKTTNRLVIIILFYGLIGVIGWRQLSSPPSPTNTSNAFNAPDFNWQDMKNQNHILHDHKGKVVVLHFWASWCAPCRTEFPSLMKAVSQQPDVIFLAISSDSDRNKAEKFLQDMGAAQPPANLFLALDSQKKITYDLFMTSAYPETIILDKNHRLRRKIPNSVEWQSADIQNYLKKLLAE